MQCGKSGAKPPNKRDELLTAFLELQRAIHEFAVSLML
jgi:hypothetical protein